MSSTNSSTDSFNSTVCPRYPVKATPIPPHIAHTLDRIVQAESERHEIRHLPQLPISATIPLYVQRDESTIPVTLVWARAVTTGAATLLVMHAESKISVGDNIFSSKMFGNGRVCRVQQMQGRYIQVHVSFDNPLSPHFGGIYKTITIPSAKFSMDWKQKIYSVLARIRRPWLEYITTMPP